MSNPFPFFSPAPQEKNNGHSDISFSDLAGGNPLLDFDNQFSDFYAQTTQSRGNTQQMHHDTTHSARNKDGNTGDVEKFVHSEPLFHPAKYLSSSNEDMLLVDSSENASMPLGLVKVTLENLDACVQHLNTRLMAQGIISTPINVKSNDDNDRTQIVSCILYLLQQRHGDMDTRDKMHDRLSRLQSDNETLSANLKKARQKLTSKSHDYEVLRVRHSSYQRESRSEQKKLQDENERMQLRVRDFQQKIVQYEHTMQRQEREGNKVKERMQRLVIDKGNARARMDIINDVPAPPTSTWKHGPERNENALYQNIVGAYEDEKQELVRENRSIREALYRLNNEVNRLRNAIYAERGKEQFETNVPELQPGQYELPYNMVQSEIEGTTMAKIEELFNVTVTEEERELLHEEKKNLAQQRSELERFASELDDKNSRLERERKKMEQLKQIEEFKYDIDVSQDISTDSVDFGGDIVDDDDYGILSPNNLRQVPGPATSTAQAAQELRDDFHKMLMGTEDGDGNDGNNNNNNDDDGDDSDTEMAMEESDFNQNDEDYGQLDLSIIHRGP